MAELEIKPGDLYEGSGFHPCLCSSVKGDVIEGISLIDGSVPHALNLKHDTVRRLTLAEALVWKDKGPQELPAGKEIAPVDQWWAPLPERAVNPGVAVSRLFEASLRFIRDRLGDRLGSGVGGWTSPAAGFDDTGNTEPHATVSYVVSSAQHSAWVLVQAEKDDGLWPIRKITVRFAGEDEPVVFEGDSLLGCG